MPLKIYLCIFNFQSKSNNISIFQCKIIFQQNSTNQSQKCFWPPFSILKFFKLYIQHTIHSIFSTTMVWQRLKRFWLFFLPLMCKNMITISWTTFCVYLITLSPLVIDQIGRRKNNGRCCCPFCNKARKKKDDDMNAIVFFFSNNEKKKTTIAIVILFATKQGKKKMMVGMPSSSSSPQIVRRRRQQKINWNY